ncbi:MAG: hypothetical protein ACLU4N_08355 [Butyricimonas faecihominis]
MSELTVDFQIDCLMNSDYKNWVFIMQGNDPTYNFPTQDEILDIMKEVREGNCPPARRRGESRPLVGLRGSGGEIVKPKR